MYDVIDTASGTAVRRDDGSYAEFMSADEAEEAKKMLVSGEADESDYEWQSCSVGK